MKLLAIIPVYNESKNIGMVVEAIKKKGLDVVVIDDGSDDNSGKIACQKGAEVLRNSKRQGKGFSLREGINYAKDKTYDGVITMDGDGQHDASDIDSFRSLAENSAADIIVGNRMEETKDMPFIRFLTNKFMSLIISLSCRQHIPDTQCGYRYLSKRALKDLKLYSDDFEIETEMLMQLSKKKFRIHSVKIRTIYQGEESKIRPLKDTFRFFRYYFREAFKKN
ncbi:MAG: glycosyltransferase family 2 protein [Candidatus Omnitrophica bacterium]|nr:glycosyltransferase family 2 protein [Candidatus Omnitrophota bacterium]